MRSIRRMVVAAALAVILLGAGAFTVKLRSQQNPMQGPANPSPLYVATFVDLMPPGTEAGTAAIKEYVLNTRKEPGIVRCEAIAQIAGRANHLIVMEVWKDQAAFDKHETTAQTREYRAKMVPLIGAPFDQREHFLVE